MHARLSFICRWLILSLVLVCTGAVAQAPRAGTSHIKWSDLVAPGWDPEAEVRKRIQGRASAPDLALLSDDDPRSQALLKQMREVWDQAPVNPAMNGVVGRIPGYVVPLEETRQGLKELLLVPYFGACIHTPPPPANQIVHVVLATPAKGYRSMDTVWVHGTLRVQRSDSAMGVSGYRIDAARLSAYEKGAGR